MGDAGITHFPTHDKEINVVVTGYQPFSSQFPVNPSWEVAARLPSFLPANRNGLPSPHGAVNIKVHPDPIRVAYADVRELVPRLWASGDQIDYMLHIGMASGRDCYSIERRGHRDGYYIPDVDGELLNDDQRHRVEGDHWVWHGCPFELLTDLDLDDVWRRWMMYCRDEDVRPSEDAGRYLCDFIYYSSLSLLWKRKERRRVLFLHVPADADEASIERGVKITIELIRAMVVSDAVKQRA